MKGFPDQFLRDIGPIAVGGVDEIDTEFGKPPQCGKRRFAIGRRAPDPGTGDPHGSITQTVDRSVSDPELTGGSSVD
jgi:hypothetical protein